MPKKKLNFSCKEINLKKTSAICWLFCLSLNVLTHWGRVTDICVGELTIIVSDNGLSPGWRQAIIWTNAGILWIGPYGANFSEILIEILTFSFTKMSLKVSSMKWRPFCLGLNVLTVVTVVLWYIYWIHPSVYTSVWLHINTWMIHDCPIDSEVTWKHMGKIHMNMNAYEFS